MKIVFEWMDIVNACRDAGFSHPPADFIEAVLNDINDGDGESIVISDDARDDIYESLVQYMEDHAVSEEGE